MTTMTETTTRTLNVPGAVLTYDVRSAGSPALPVLLVIGSPMGASGFVTLAGHFTDRTVVTYDPRGVERSAKADPASPSTPEEHADDLHRIIAQLDAGPVDIFANSGGAVNALALVARHPEQVRTLVAHEPPLASILPDREGALAACRAVNEAYQRSGFGAGMARFIVAVSHKGPFGGDDAAQPGPDPAMFGLPAADDGNRTDPLLGQNIISCTHFEPDFEALRSASTRIVLAAGAESEGEMAHRGAVAVAERLGTTPVSFPSGHGGFLGGEYGQRGEPDALRREAARGPRRSLGGAAVGSAPAWAVDSSVVRVARGASQGSVLRCLPAHQGGGGTPRILSRAPARSPGRDVIPGSPPGCRTPGRRALERSEGADSTVSPGRTGGPRRLRPMPQQRRSGGPKTRELPRSAARDGGGCEVGVDGDNR